MRDYKKEYREYHGTAEQRKRRSQRVLARRKMEKKHGKAKLQGKDVDHKDRNPHNNGYGNLRISKPSENRGRNK